MRPLRCISDAHTRPATPEELAAARAANDDHCPYLDEGAEVCRSDSCPDMELHPPHEGMYPPGWERRKKSRR